MATGRRAFSGATTAVIFEAILNKSPTPPVQINTNLPAELERIISKALKKDPDLRYQHASDMCTDLKRLKRDTSSGRISVGRALCPPSHLLMPCLPNRAPTRGAPTSALAAGARGSAHPAARPQAWCGSSQTARPLPSLQPS